MADVGVIEREGLSYGARIKRKGLSYGTWRGRAGRLETRGDGGSGWSLVRRALQLGGGQPPTSLQAL